MILTTWKLPHAVLDVPEICGGYLTVYLTGTLPLSVYVIDA
jgi:hypothetical protein